MTYKMYLVSISGLDEECFKEVMCLLDSYRRELVYKYSKEKDRVRAIVAGLLLQVGFLELEPDETFCRNVKMPDGQCYILDGRNLAEYIKEAAKEQTDNFPLELIYEKGSHGKPCWKQEVMDAVTEKSGGETKKLRHFNLSHSGDYVVLAVSDAEVGVDIQEPREVKSFPGGYREFSRMEAFVKCTGDGYAHGVGTYKMYQGNIPGYEIRSLELAENYALHLCFRK